MKLPSLAFVGIAIAQLIASRLSAAPAISSFSPSFGAATDPGFISIVGSGFYPGTLVVKFNGVTDTTAVATAADGTSIQARVPAGATNGSNPIFVSVNGVGTYSALDFTVIGSGPYITGFTPTMGASGAGVTISGAHFTSPFTVRFNGQVAPGPAAPTTSQITVTAPVGVTTGPISVTTASGSYTSATFFYVPPVISSFTPAAGRNGDSVIIRGTNFLGATAVRFNGVDAPGFNVLSNGAIQVAIPATANSGLLRVIAPAGSAFSSSNFVVLPTITSFSPGFGPVNTSVTILGANLNGSTPVVKFNGTTAAAPTGVSFSQLTAVVPAGATTGPISVTTTDGTATSTNNFYLPPVITAFAPSNTPPGTLVRVSGTNFTGVTAVAFNGTPAAFYFTNNNSLGAIVPADVTSGPISVTTPGGTANSAARFYGAPVIGSFLPTHGLPGTNVTLTGQNFLDASAVRFNGVNASFSVVNNTTINATVPNNAQTGPISVIAPAGTNTSAQNFTLDYTANLSVTVSDAPDPVVVSSNVTYSILIQNAGPFAAPGVTLSDTLIGPGLLVAASASQGTLNTNSSPFTGALGQINVGSAAIVTLTVAAQDAGMITNLASVASQYTDPNPANNSATNTTYVQPLPLLSVRRINPDRVRVIWSAALTNYALEFKPELTLTNFWSNVVTLPAIVGGEYQLTETNTAAMRFYRLRRLP